MMANKRQTPLPFLTIIIILIVISFLGSIVRLYTDYLWFDSLGFASIFTTILSSKIWLFVGAALIFFIFGIINLYVSSKFRKSSDNFIPFKVKTYIMVLFAFFIGLSASNKWFVWLQFFNQAPFSIREPIFAKDAAFYVFSLPFLNALWNFALAVVVITAIIVAIDYLQSFIASLMRGPKQVDPLAEMKTVYPRPKMPKLKRSAIIHLSALVAFIFVIFAVKHYLSKYSIMFSEQGIVVGAGYTDVMVYIPIVKALMGAALVIAALIFVWAFFISKRPKLRKRHLLLYAIGVYVLAVIVLPPVIQGIVQSWVVDPNEFNLEKPYIENNILFTNVAYGLDGVEIKEFAVNQTLDAQILETESDTIDNVRILDWRPLTQTYKQTQELRNYYSLSGIDIDRYTIGDDYRQVMIAPRELDQDQITAEAQTWVNMHMVYTHGYGVVMSPVNEVTAEGLPNYFIQNIPPTYDEAVSHLKLERPQIYYGEMDNEYVLVNTKTPELDYPKGDQNIYTNYEGKGGVQLDSFFKKAMMALRFKDIKIILSGEITEQSRIMFHRSIKERIAKITPFLRLDNDPYTVINNGRLLWIQDAYTVTGNFPYSQNQGRINYIRNSVKIVVDAYEGSVTYYIMDDEEPLMKTYASIFPGEFKPFSEMPESLSDNLRYPEDLFRIQSEVYSTYHMLDPNVFYNKEEKWQIPIEIYGTGQQIPMEPYYVIMKLPGEANEEFVLMTPFTIVTKPNMISWLAARMDGEEYGKLILFQFPEDKLVEGPIQVEAKFDQDSEISQQLTLWSQQGSTVTRGNLLVIPIQDSILYIEPLYIEAEQGTFPQLKRILASDGERVVMEETLESALAELFGRLPDAEDEEEGVPQEGLPEDLLSQAQLYYDNILESMQNQDWSGIGDNLNKLGEVLNRLDTQE